MTAIESHLASTHSTSAALIWHVLTASQIEEGLALWRQLELRLGNVPVACSSTWTESWLQVYGDVVPYQLLVAESGGLVRGLCLLTHGVGQKDGPFSVRTRHLGTAGEPQPGSVCVEYNGLLVDPNFRSEFIADLSRRLMAEVEMEQFRLDGFPVEELSLWQQHFPTAAVRSRDSRYFDLAAARMSGTDVLSQLGKSTRSNLKRRLKQYGELTCEWASDITQAEDILQELIQLHQARWQAIGEPGAFASERFLEFQQQASLKLFLEGKAVLFRVRQQNDTIGCLLLLNDRQRLLDYLSGFASFEEKPSPGLISHYLCMCEALKRNFDAYDFLVGDKRHKDNLSNQVAQLGWMTWSRPSLKSAVLSVCRRMKGRLSRSSQSEVASQTATAETTPAPKRHGIES